MSILASLALAGMAMAITPQYDTFGNLAEATWGGSGIPTDPAAITRIGPPTAQMTLGLIAHQRCFNPPLTNDGAGTYFAQAGIDTHAPSPANPYATWNFGWYIGGASSAYDVQLRYDFDPAAANDESSHGTVSDLLLALVGDQNSWNLGMDFLDLPVPGLVTEPAYPSFDPQAAGRYTFALVAFDQAGAEVGRAAIAVQVGDLPAEVPTPGSLALATLALAAAGAAGRRRPRVS